MFKVNNGKNRTKCDLWSKLTIKKPERPQWRRSGVFIVNFKYISNPALVFLLLTLMPTRKEFLLSQKTCPYTF